ncbi:MAG: CBS domain-containing protein [Chloroflexi bacterium]|nr:CBS domain-containing protein [Chloroflexota bacterium]MBU1749810.1 CBS domain-containing protein [Chloroflexota bacterium]MBU1878723.1 CBS domain-containing protein [Chloroflexota bacterium]
MTGTQDKQVKDIMHKGVITCKDVTPLTECVRVMADTDVHAIIVMEGGKIDGIISHMDVLRLYHQELEGKTAESIMTPSVVAVTPDTPVADAVRVMLEHDIHRLLVVEETLEGQQPVGVLSTTDVIREMRGSKWVWYMG